MQIKTITRQSIGLVFQPRPERFREAYQYPGASFGKALLIAFVTQIIVGAITYVGWLAYPFYNGLFEGLGVSTETLLQMTPLLAPSISSLSLLTNVFYGLLSFAVLVFLSSFVAVRLFSGEGEWGRYAYIIALFQATFNIVLNLLLIFIPLVGGCLGLFFGYYGLFLLYRAIKFSFSLDTGRAFGTVIVAAGVFLALWVGGSQLINLGHGIYIGP